jgi:hypothetical protein
MEAAFTMPAAVSRSTTIGLPGRRSTTDAACAADWTLGTKTRADVALTTAISSSNHAVSDAFILTIAAWLDQPGCDVLPCHDLVGVGHGILEIEDHPIRSAGCGLREAFRTIGRNEQQTPGDPPSPAASALGAVRCDTRQR